ncbi:MAG: four helix bundle protein [Elusimicrobiota bacterium]|jgi:four helix bundle protein
MREYKKLLVWQKANELAHQIYTISESFPKEHRFGLTSQLQRAALSVPTNIVEGSYSSHDGEFHQFLNIAFRSLGETSYLLQFAYERKLLSDAHYSETRDCINQTEKMLAALLASVKRSR